MARSLSIRGLLWLAATLLLLAPLLSGCTAAKEAEGVVYDFSAAWVSELGERLGSAEDSVRIVAERELVEWRREVCQRGWGGPEIPPEHNYGDCRGGPVVEIRFYFAGDEVPLHVLEGLERNWR